MVVSISIEQPGARIFEVSTSSIMVNNLADELQISYDSTVDLEIQIKGPSAVLMCSP